MRELWRSLYGGGDAGCYIGLSCGVRSIPGAGKLLDPRSAYFEYPRQLREAEAWCLARSAKGREAYYLRPPPDRPQEGKGSRRPGPRAVGRRRRGRTAGRVPRPTAVVESSPGRRHLFWRLNRPLSPSEAEVLNRRLSRAVGADPSG